MQISEISVLKTPLDEVAGQSAHWRDLLRVWKLSHRTKASFKSQAGVSSVAIGLSVGPSLHLHVDALCMRQSDTYQNLLGLLI